MIAFPTKTLRDWMRVDDSKQFRLPCGVVIAEEQFYQAIEFFKKRVHTVKELVQEIDRFFKPSQDGL